MATNHGMKYSSEEDKIILDEVAKNGYSVNTWKTLTNKLNRSKWSGRSYYNSIRLRYVWLLQNGSYKKGKWSIEEDAILLEHLFRNKPRNINTVKSMKLISTSSIEIRREKRIILNHYQAVLKPTLLDHHLGTLDSNWKYNFLMHIISKNCKSSKEVIYEELLEAYPSQTHISLSNALNEAIQLEQRSNKNLDFLEALKLHAIKIRNTEDYSKRKKEYRQKIVDIYLKCTLPTE